MRAIPRFLFVIALLLLPGAAKAQVHWAQSVTAEQAAARVMSETGKVRLVYIYRSTCPACDMILDDFVAMASQFKDQAVILPLSTDVTPGALNQYLNGENFPFERIQIKPWQPGEFDKAFAPTGIEIGKSFGTPLFAVIDANDRVIGQHEGANGVGKAEKWLRKAATGAGQEEGGFFSSFFR